MLATIRSLPALASQFYRSGQAFFALRQLHKGAAQGIALDSNPGLIRFAKAMKVHPMVARDIYMGRLSRSSSAEDIVNARKTLLGTHKLLPILAPASRNTAFQTNSLFQDVVKVHKRAIAANVKLASQRARKLSEDRKAMRAFAKQGQKHSARAIREQRAFDTQTLDELNKETQILLRGNSTNLVDKA